MPTWALWVLVLVPDWLRLVPVLASEELVARPWKVSQGAMLIIAALIEVPALFGLVVCLMISFQGSAA